MSLLEVFLFESSQPVEARLPGGETIRVEFNNREGNDRFESDILTEDGEYMGCVEVDYWPQRKRAFVYLATLRTQWLGKKVGTTVYPIVDAEVYRRWKVRLSSDKDADRSEAATGLWKSFEKKGMAKRDGDHYVMTGDK